MGPMLLIGLAVVAAGGAFVGFMLFGQRTNPLPDATAATIPVEARSPRPGSGANSQLRPVREATSPSTDGEVNIRWHQRLRSSLLLLLIVAGLGTALGAIVGALILGVSLLLG